MTKLYALKDKTIGFSEEIFPAINKMDALRRIADAVNNNERKTILTEHPSDFSLFELGEYNTDTGAITPKVEFIEEALNLVKKGKQ